MDEIIGQTIHRESNKAEQMRRGRGGRQASAWLGNVDAHPDKGIADGAAAKNFYPTDMIGGVIKMFNPPGRHLLTKSALNTDDRSVRGRGAYNIDCDSRQVRFAITDCVSPLCPYLKQIGNDSLDLGVHDCCRPVSLNRGRGGGWGLKEACGPFLSYRDHSLLIFNHALDDFGHNVGMISPITMCLM